MNDYELRNLEWRQREFAAMMEREFERRYHWRRQRIFWVVAGVVAGLGVIANALPSIESFGQTVGWW